MIIIVGARGRRNGTGPLGLPQTRFSAVREYPIPAAAKAYRTPAQPLIFTKVELREHDGYERAHRHG